jgi:hypothetical protein
LKTIAAVDRLIAARLERYLSDAAALAASRLIHFPALTAAAAHSGPAAATRTHLFACLTAIGATVGLVLKTFAGIELLLTGSERELTSAIHTIQHFIDVH